MPTTLQRRLNELVASYNAHLSHPAREALALLPPGWLEPVRGMIERAQQILDESEFGTFRWTAFDTKRGRLLASWSGAGDADVLIDQIVEEAAHEVAHTCIECGAATLFAVSDMDGPRCLFHAALRKGRHHARSWEISALELVNTLRGGPGGWGSLSPKAIAAALPILIQEAAAYYRAPDQDAPTIARQIHEAFQTLERSLRPFDRSGAAATDG